MTSLNLELENCYGIKKLNHEFNFTPEHNVNVIYAKNGLMKTSFAKVFKKFQDGKENEIADMIFGNTPIKNVKVDDNDIVKEEIFVIKSFEKAYESDSISSLLINDSIKTQLVDIIRIKKELFITLEEKSGLDLKKAVSTKGFLKLEEQVIKDLSFEEQSFLQNIDSVNLDDIDYDYPDIKYSTIFHKAVLNNIKKANFQSSIRAYLEKSDEIYRDYTFFEKGNFNLPKLKSIEKELKASNFFVKTNKIHLDGSGEFANLQELTDKIKEIELKLQETNEFKAIDTALGTKDGKDLKDLIESNVEILEELTLANLDNLRKKLWYSYLKVNEDSFNDLKNRYSVLTTAISALNPDDTLWKEAVNIFNERFTLPFTMSIDNPMSSIIGESLPKIIFEFTEGNNPPVSINRDELEDGDTLSQGEKRALYLLNIIFDIEKRKKENQKTLFIVDDIADSFDYKNKYAIIEYLNEISKFNDFYMIILSHNFDFYRTISSRLNLPFRQNRFHAIKTSNGIDIVNEHYQNQPFKVWKNNLNDNKNIIALIPYVRNLIEYGIDDKRDYMFLTHLLHIKTENKYKQDGKLQSAHEYDPTNGDFTIPSIYDINIQELKQLYRKYIGKDDFNTGINNTDKVFNLIINTADTNISDEETNLENKIILALAIRLKAEEFMLHSINASATHTFTWKNTNGSNHEFLNYVNGNGNQTRELFNGFSQIGQNDKIQVLESVNIMTPENIHLNSFMYEPLLDMDIVELKRLYSEVLNL